MDGRGTTRRTRPSGPTRCGTGLERSAKVPRRSTCGDGSPSALAMSPKQLAGAGQQRPVIDGGEQSEEPRDPGLSACGPRTRARKSRSPSSALARSSPGPPAIRPSVASSRCCSPSRCLRAPPRLYGPGPSARPQLPPGQPAPPIGQTVDHDDDGVIDAEFDVEPEQTSTPPASDPPPRPPCAAPHGQRRRALATTAPRCPTAPAASAPEPARAPRPQAGRPPHS